MRLHQAIGGYLVMAAADGLSPTTLAVYKIRLRQMAHFLHNAELNAITPADVQRYWRWLRNIPPKGSPDPNRRYAEATLASVWGATRSFFRWAETEFADFKRPDRAIKMPAAGQPAITPYTQEQIKALLKACTYTRTANTNGRRAFAMKRPTAARDTALVLLLLDTGLRASEVSRLLVQAVDLETGEVYVRPWGSGKKTKSRHVYLGKAARRAVWRYFAKRGDAYPEDPLFLTRANRPMDRHAMRRVLRRLGKRAGVMNVHPHRFRHTFAIQFLRNGGDVFSLQRLLGHSTLDMVKHYLAIADSDAQDAYRRASPADRWHL